MDVGTQVNKAGDTSMDGRSSAAFTIKDALRFISEKLRHGIKAEPPVIAVTVCGTIVLLAVSIFGDLFASAESAGIVVIILIAALLSSLFVPTIGAIASFLAALFSIYVSYGLQQQGNDTIANFVLTDVLVMLIASELMLGYLKRWKKLACLMPISLAIAIIITLVSDNAAPGKPRYAMDSGLLGVMLVIIFPWILGMIARQQSDMRGTMRKEDELRRATIRLEATRQNRRMAATLHNKVMEELKSINVFAGQAEALTADGRQRIAGEAKKALNEMHQVINLFDEISDAGEPIGNGTATYGKVARIVHLLRMPRIKEKRENPARQGVPTTSRTATHTVLQHRPISNRCKASADIHDAVAPATETTHGPRTETNRKITAKTNGKVSHSLRLDRFTAPTIAISLTAIIVSTFIPSPYAPSLSLPMTALMALLSLLMVFLPTAGAAIAFIVAVSLIMIPGIPHVAAYIMTVCSGILLGYSRRGRHWSLWLCVAMTVVFLGDLILVEHDILARILTMALLTLAPWKIGRYARRQQGLNHAAWINSQLLTKTTQLNKEHYDGILAEAIHDSITNELSTIILLTDDPNRKWTNQTLQLVGRAAQDAFDNIGEVIDLLNGTGNTPNEFNDATRDVHGWLVARLAHEDSSLHALGYTGISQVRGGLGKGEKANMESIGMANHLLTEIYTNIVRHASPGIDGYALVAELENGWLRITETNDCSGSGLELKGVEHGKGLGLHKDSVEAMGGTFETAAEDDSWIVNCTIPLATKQKDHSKVGQ
ncbi:hypothetical protein [Bifidobacterium sp. ESL0732]|uniref:hypothetical protein n=1 Tax=Bifidobacterium sp. ESL0732 TaxID=2983222 RepID=UPI0023F9DFBC|nr:hypothetical protein [Bifidobacterium sp. ESL0732]WEV64034.1 hypothetical protein OZX70_00025 [Bifidobacterium sp. ESL0732]